MTASIRTNFQSSMKEAAPILLGLAGTFAAVVTIWLNINVAQAAVVETEIPEEVYTETTADDELTLPAFNTHQTDGELSRRVDPSTQISQRSRVEILRYTVQSGDAVFSIAKKYGIKPETLLWGNYEVLNDDPHLLKPGQELNILPVDGTYYQWKEGDKIEAVADEFGVEPLAILEWPGNRLDPADPDIEPGVWLVVPGGSRPLRQWLVPDPIRPQAGVGSAYGPGGCSGDYSGGAVGTGGFIWPTSNHYLSGNDYWSGHLAIDIAAGYGSAIWAADSGVIVFAGWSTVGYGNMVMIDHGNGYLTLYGHLDYVSVGCGQSVYQGQTIGGGGSTGNSTGPHLHFEVRYQGGFINPWYVLP
jgi:murein DD-endopeptidase MepM/ murein hydrolase activator NlpD